MDYIVSLLLVARPWLFDFARGGAETILPLVLGFTAILYSFYTDYELGAVRYIDMGFHLTLDLINGAFLALSPWLFGFDDHVWIPHVMFGLLEITASIFTLQLSSRTPFLRGDRVAGDAGR